MRIVIMWGEEERLYKQLFPSNKQTGIIIADRKERMRELLDKELALSVYMSKEEKKNDI